MGQAEVSHDAGITQNYAGLPGTVDGRRNGPNRNDMSTNSTSQAPSQVSQVHYQLKGSDMHGIMERALSKVCVFVLATPK